MDDSEEDWSRPPRRPEGDWAEDGYVTPEARAIVEERRLTRPWDPRGPAFEMADVPDDAYPDGVLAVDAVETLGELSSAEEPFFLAVGFFKPHLPYNAPKRYWDLYDLDDIEVPSPLMARNAPWPARHNFGELRGYEDVPGGYFLPEDYSRKLIHGYLAATSYVDAQIGRVLDELDRLGLRDDTIVVVLGDHGYHLGEQGLWCKHCNFDDVLRAPLMIRAPGVSRPARTQALVEFIDIFPTLCDLTGLTPPTDLDGKSLRSELEAPDGFFKEKVFARYIHAETVVTENFAYTEWYWRPTEEVYATMLYDHRLDSEESVNVADYAEYREAVRDLSASLAALRFRAMEAETVPSAN